MILIIFFNLLCKFATYAILVSWFLVLVDLRLTVTGCDADGFFFCFFDAAGLTETGWGKSFASDGVCSTRTWYNSDGLTVGHVCFCGPRWPIL